MTWDAIEFGPRGPQLIVEPRGATGRTPPYVFPGSDFASLTHFWLLNENAGNRMDSKAGLTLRETYPVPGDGKSCNFGLSASGLLKTTPFSLDVPFSVSVWLNAQASTLCLVLGKSTSVQDGGFQIFNDAGALTVSLGLVGDGMTSNTPLSLNKWNHAVFTIDGTTTGTLYVNGNLRDSGVMTPTLTDGPLSIGKTDPDGTGVPSTRIAFPGRMTNLMFFNVALTVAQVGVLYNNGINPT